GDNPAVHIGETFRCRVEPVEVAIEDNVDGPCFAARQPFDRIERAKIAVQAADDVEGLGSKVRRSCEGRRRVAVVNRAEPAGLLHWSTPQRNAVATQAAAESPRYRSTVRRGWCRAATRMPLIACFNSPIAKSDQALSAPPQLLPCPAVQP